MSLFKDAVDHEMTKMAASVTRRLSALMYTWQPTLWDPVKAYVGDTTWVKGEVVGFNRDLDQYIIKTKLFTRKMPLSDICPY